MLVNRLFQGEEVSISEASLEHEEALALLTAEPFCRVDGGRLVLVPVTELDAAGVSRLFLSLCEGPIGVAHLSFMVDHHHDRYVDRLIESLAELQSGLALMKRQSRPCARSRRCSPRSGQPLLPLSR